MTERVEGLELDAGTIAYLRRCQPRASLAKSAQRALRALAVADAAQQLHTALYASITDEDLEAAERERHAV